MTVVNIVNVGRKQEFRVLCLPGKVEGIRFTPSWPARINQTGRDYNAGSEAPATAAVFTRTICDSSVKK